MVSVNPRAAVDTLISTPGYERLAQEFLAGVELGQPLIENLNRPEARVYEINSQDFGFVMVVDENFEV